jgi:selenocysteine-specific elongation factor
MARGDAAEGVRLRIERAGLQGIGSDRLALETGLDARALGRILDALAQAETIVRVDASLNLGKLATERLMGELLGTLEAFHAREPLQPGMPRAALSGTLPENVSNEARAGLLKTLAERGEVAIEGEIVSRVGFQSTLDPAQTEIADRLRKRFDETGLEAPALRTLAEESGDDERTLRDLAHFLERQGVLVAAPDDLFFDRRAFLDLIDRVVAHFDSAEELDTQTLKALIGTSRRTAMPLMALLDDLQITRRDGSIRRLVGSAPRW